MVDEAIGVGLADAIETVRAELEAAIERGKGSVVAFEAGPVEMEFEVTFTATAGGEAGFKAWVVNVGGKGEVTRGSAGRLTVSLQPVEPATRVKKLVGDIGER